MKSLYCLLFVAVAVANHEGHNHDHDSPARRAIAVLRGENIEGSVTFTELPDNRLRVQGVVKGMPPGMYGFHVHEFGDISNGCTSAGGHFNPDNKLHGHPSDIERHAGDLGNVEFDANEVAHIDLTDHEIQLHGRKNIIGRAVVLHKGEDDFGRTDHPDSKKTGNAGGRAACGVIGIY